VASYFDCSGPVLRIGGVAVNEVAAQYDTPLFIYDRGVFERKFAMLQEALPPGFEIYYSVKANPNRTILAYWLSKGCGLEVASGGEFYQALAARCDPRRILFAGPGKTDAELQFVLEHGIGEIHVESLQEVERLARICDRLGTSAHIAVRVNPSEEAQGGAMRMGGLASPFGVDEEELDVVLQRVLAEERLRLQGLHFFTGTQILDYTVLICQYRKALAIARKVAARLKTSLRIVDFGGGLGIPYYPNDTELEIARFGDELRPFITEAKAQPEFADTRFLVEPGRYLVGEGGLYVMRVTTIKASRGKKFLIVDGGMHHHLAASGNLGQVIKRNFPVALLTKLQDNATETVHVVGPLCTPLDMLARDVELPAAAVGDLLGVFQSGAYARASSPLGFLSHPTPPEVWIVDGGSCLIRRRGTYEDMVQDLQPMS
jgi:diaminopimelate decarboxylase